MRCEVFPPKDGGGEGTSLENAGCKLSAKGLLAQKARGKPKREWLSVPGQVCLCAQLWAMARETRGAEVRARLPGLGAGAPRILHFHVSRMLNSHA